MRHCRTGSFSARFEIINRFDYLLNGNAVAEKFKDPFGSFIRHGAFVKRTDLRRCRIDSRHFLLKLLNGKGIFRLGAVAGSARAVRCGKIPLGIAKSHAENCSVAHIERNYHALAHTSRDRAFSQYHTFRIDIIVDAGKAILYGQTHRIAYQFCDSSSVEIRKCRHYAQIVQILPEKLAFKDSFLITSAPQVGFRESRRIRGVHILTAEEYASAYHFPDSVARGAHPIDIHRAAETKQDVRFLEKAGYIPYRALIADGFDNLLVAGRCISADRAAFASTRVMATAMALGEAAGTAAALCVREKCDTTVLDIALLRNTLIAQGAII